MSRSPYTQVQAGKLLDRIIALDDRMVLVDTPGSEELVDRLRHVAVRSGTSIYFWQAGAGLAALRDGGLQVPGSRRLSETLRYVMQSLHFGVYLFSNFEGELSPVDVLLLRRIVRIPAANERKLLFLSPAWEPPEELDGMYVRLAVADPASTRLRLRGGQWVR